MTAEIHGTSLRVEMALRGWTNAQLASEAGVSRATVTAALKGDAIAAKSIYKILLALKLNPPMDMPTGMVRAS